MKAYGKTVREIRLAKGFLQKDIYQDVVVKSFAIRFEKGEVMLQYDTFLTVLENLSVTPEEFHFIYHGYVQVENRSIWGEFAKAANQGNVHKLKEMYAEHKKSKMNYHKVIALLAHLTFLSVEENTAHVSQLMGQDEVTFLKEYLLQSNMWTLDETNIFTTCYHIFDIPTQETLMANCYHALKQYEGYFTYEERMFRLLTNYIFHVYLEGRFDEGNDYCEKLLALPRNKERMYEISRVDCCHGFYLYIKDSKDEGEKMVKKAQQVLSLMDFQEEATSVEKAFDVIKIQLDILKEREN